MIGWLWRFFVGDFRPRPEHDWELWQDTTARDGFSRRRVLILRCSCCGDFRSRWVDK